MEQHEIESELVVELAKRIKKFNPEKAPWGRFVRLVINGKAKKLLRHFTGVNEMEWRKCRSLDAPADYDEDGMEVTLGGCLVDRSRASLPESWDTDIDVADAVHDLPEEQQAAFALLRLDDNQSKVAEAMKMKLSTFRDRCLYPLRERLAPVLGQ